MTAFVVTLAIVLGLVAASRFTKAAEEVGYPEDAGTTRGRFRIAMVSGLATFSLIIGPWLLVAPTGA